MGTITIHTNENFALWVEDLATTSEYQCTEKLQGIVYDHDDIDVGEAHVAFCCLGRGLEVAGEALGIKWVEGADEYVGPQDRGSNSMPHIEWLRWIGVDTDNRTGLTPFDSDNLTAPPLIGWPEGLETRTCNGCGRDPVTPDGIENNQACPYDDHVLNTLSQDVNLRHAAGLNDEAKLTFAQIADVLRYFGIKDHL